MLGVVLAAACGSNRAAALSPPDHKAQFKVRVDPRVELLCIVLRLAGFPEYRMAPDFPYARDVDAQFETLKEHPAVVTSRRLREEHGIAFDAPIDLAVYLDDQLRPLMPLSPRPPALDERWSDVDLEGYVAELQAFAKASAFATFFAQHRAYFAHVEARFRDHVVDEDVVGWFDGFFGRVADASYTIVPGMLTGPANYGPKADVPGRALALYQVVSLEDLDDKQLPRPSQSTIKLLVHELAHSYVNSLFDRHSQELEPSLSAIYALVAPHMKRQGYGAWDAMAYESGVRAITLLYLRDRKGAEIAASAQHGEQRRWFLWAGELADLFDRYRRSRDRYRDLDAYFPEVVRFFDGVAKRYANGLPRVPFPGPIAEVDPTDAAVVGPEGNSEGTEALRAYVDTLRTDVFRGAATAPASGKPLILFGSPSTNPIVARMVSDAGWKITAAGIAVAGRRFDGADLALIVCRPDPDDPHRGVLIYTAARDEQIVGIHGARHRATDWVVVRRNATGELEKVGSGNFEVDAQGRWLFTTFVPS
ncbi:MAG: DUF4932 domain-containing protein [Kofleriaceae bacterium]